MTEDLWFANTDVETMLAFAAGRNAPPGAVVPLVGMSDRKIRLFLVGCCRCQWALFDEPLCQEAVEVGERFADGLAADGERTRAAQALSRRQSEAISEAISRGDPGTFIQQFDLAWGTCLPDDLLTRQQIYYGRSRDFVPVSPAARHIYASKGLRGNEGLYAGLLRCVAGNPFRRAVIDPDWVPKDTLGLATVLYSKRSFDELPILSDALEEAGCDDADLLSHLRSPDPHVRGCHAVDLVLGLS